MVEPQPLFDPEYIDFLYWLADYYCASISDVISAAVPSMLSTRWKRQVTLNRKAQSISSSDTGNGIADTSALCLIHLLDQSKTAKLSMVTLKQRWRKVSGSQISHFYRALNFLRQEGLIGITDEATSVQTPRFVNMVIWTGKDPGHPRHQKLVDVIIRHGGQMSVAELYKQAHTTQPTIKKLVAEGVLSVLQEERFRDPLQRITPDEIAQPIDLTEYQSNVLAILLADLKKVLAGCTGCQRVEPWLLHGVTGSGKTEVYLRLIDETLRAGRTAMLLVPEISLTPQLARRLKSRFGAQVSVWHSALSDGERYDTWRRMKDGDIKILLGARSAVLSNLPGLGLIILDEEHDGSYKQSSPSPRYHAQEVALERARRAGAVVILGSATPDVSSFKAATENGRLLELPERVFKQAMPQVTIVDMRHEFSLGNRSIFSRLLLQELNHCVVKTEQAIMLINRRGYASHVFCRACGYVVKCRNCSVSMVFHQRNDGSGSDFVDGSSHLACHHCGYQCSSTQLCPSCRSPFIKPFGLGTQRVEVEIKQRFDTLRVLRLDSDTAARKGAHEEILGQFAQGKADLLIGTQMVAKGLDIPSVTLVGILAADAAFNLPDYRSIERGFQLLTQVSGRAGRGQCPGKVILQTYDTEMPALTWARTHNYHDFVKEELNARAAFGYPPFSQLIRLVITGSQPLEVEAACHRLAEQIGCYLEDILPVDKITVLGPAPCVIERLRGKYRYHLLIKNFAGDEGRIALTNFLRQQQMPADLSLAVDVDAIDLI